VSRASRERESTQLADVPDLRTLFATSFWGWRLIWNESAGLVIAIGFVTVLRGVLPAALALVIRALVNTVVAQINAGVADWGALVPWLMSGFALAAVEAVARLVNTYQTLRLGDDLHLRVTTNVMEHAARLDLAFFEDPSRQDLVQRTQQNTGPRFAKLVLETQTAATSLIQAVTLLGVLAVIEPRVLWAVPPFAIPFFLFQWRLAQQRYAEEHARATKRRWTAYHTSLMTSPYSVPEVRLLDLGPLLVDRFRELMMEFRSRDRALHRRNLTGSWVAALLTLAAFWGLFAHVTLQTIAGAATVGDLAIFAGATGRLQIALEQVIRSLSGAYEQTLFVQNLREFLGVQPLVASGAVPVDDRTAASIRVENVSFAYPGSEQPVLRKVSFEIAKGETVAIVGENGAGKTTLAKLIARLYDPDVGRVLWNGVDLRELNRKALHSRIGFVLQDFGRYEGTVADNIAFGDWRRLLDARPQVEKVARTARVDRLIGELKDGYDTLIGRRFGTVNLSGGQWQQLAVARASARDASLLILDEPTSTLDARSEFELFSRFRELAAGRTTILISHRFSTIAMADRIIVMEEGEIVEMGSHDELIAASGKYAALCALHRRQLPW